jgi:hypothetical protein
MQIKTPSLKRILTLSIFGYATLLLVSCGSYQNTSDSDGIYATNDRSSNVSEEKEIVEDNSKNNYYKQYFKSKASATEQIPEEDLIFTDIDSYTSNETLDEDGYIIEEEEESYGAWGENSSDVTINVVNTGGYFYGAGWYGGWYRPWGYSVWNRPFNGYGYGNWGIGFGWGGYYNPWYCAPFYGGNYYNNNYAYNNNYRNNNYTYTSSRSISR